MDDAHDTKLSKRLRGKKKSLSFMFLIYVFIMTFIPFPQTDIPYNIGLSESTNCFINIVYKKEELCGECDENAYKF